MANVTIDTPPTPIAAPAIDPFLIVISVIVVLVSFFFNFKIVAYYLNPLDKGVAHFQKAIVILGLTFAEAAVLLLPLDVANKGGLVGCGVWNNNCGGLNMEGVWQGIFIAIFVMCVAVIPFGIFYYEADDGQKEKDSVKAKLIEATKYTVCTIVITLAFVLIVFSIFTVSLKAQSNIPLTKVTLNLKQNFTDTATGKKDTFFTHTFKTYPSPDLIPAQLDGNLEVACNGAPADAKKKLKAVCVVDANANITSDVTFPIFLIALFGFAGWVLFMFFAGIGLLALPVDLINSFITRPKYISLDIYTKNRIALDNRLTELIEIGEKIFEECETAKTLPKSERKKAKGANSITINKYKQAVYFLEQDYEDLQICHYAIKNNTSNPLWYFLYLFLGILSIIISVLFLLQIILYIIPIQVVGAPLSVFLNGYFIWFDGFFPLFGTLSVAFFAMFLLACVMKGVFKFGMRFFLLPIHPMKPQDTYMNSFLFNLIFVLLCIIPTVQFCSQAFRDYARLTDIDVIFAGQVTYMDYFKYVYEYNVFIYGMLIVSMLTTLYLIICPGGGEKEKTHDQLRSLMLDERAAADKKAAREAERAAKYLKT